jgi:hypothetical protein
MCWFYAEKDIRIKMEGKQTCGIPQKMVLTVTSRRGEGDGSWET